MTQVGRPGPVAITVWILDGLAVSPAPEVFHAGQVSGPSATLDCCGLFPVQVPVVAVAQADRLDTEHGSATNSEQRDKHDSTDGKKEQPATDHTQPHEPVGAHLGRQ